MPDLSKTAAICLGAAGLAFLGYCVYFDRKRRCDPQYKEKLRERRKKQRTAQPRSTTGGSSRPVPDLTDTQAVQAFFLQEIQTGEAKLALGMEDEGVEHLVSAVSVCGQPHQLLQVLQQTLPPNIFQKLVKALPTAQGPLQPPKPSVPKLEEVEDDLE
ncbi:mitochondrial import receptor subunit TOM20 homolog [Watersipora subatra]|uniref:mitochondrial import receptor subunit TOM20 homolog n=1 Tax=Watersipora subatra TaxID=2589382 RepID=UPI00355AF812